MCIFMFTAVPMVFAEVNVTSDDITTVQVGKEYTGLDQAWDRVKLAFTFQEQRKVELINKIEQRRELHYSFLIANGKTVQAEKFQAKTIGLEKNFEQWKAKKADKLAKMEGKVAEEVVREKIQERLENKTQFVENKVQQRKSD